MITLEKLRAYRMFNLTLVDLVPTLIIAYIVHLLLWIYPLDLNDKENRTWSQYFLSLFIIVIWFLGLGIIFHRIFGIKSALSAYLGFNGTPKRS